MEDASGKNYTTQQDITKAFLEHHGQVYESSHPIAIEEILQEFKTKIPAASQDALEKPYTNEEVKDALFQMDPLKSPDSDGFSACFYQRYCHLVRELVSSVVINLLNGQGSWEHISATLIL